MGRRPEVILHRRNQNNRMWAIALGLCIVAIGAALVFYSIFVEGFHWTNTALGFCQVLVGTGIFNWARRRYANAEDAHRRWYFSKRSS